MVGGQDLREEKRPWVTRALRGVFNATSVEGGWRERAGDFPGVNTKCGATEGVHHEWEGGCGGNCGFQEEGYQR